MTTFFPFLARHARFCLVLGLCLGLAFPTLAAALRPWVPVLVGLALFVTALRVGAGQLSGPGARFGRSVAGVLLLQIAVPLIVLAALFGLGYANTPLAIATMMALSAPTISGAPNFTIMVGHDPGSAMRLFLLGTVLFPFTVLPVLWVALPDAGAGLAGAALQLIAVTALAAGGGFGLRAVFVQKDIARWHSMLDGLATLFLSVLVVGLMAAAGPLLRTDPMAFLGWLALAFLLNTGVQALVLIFARRNSAESGVALSIVAGNRNVALFLIALPAATIDPVLAFIGCYQIPMFLTPILMRLMLRPSQNN